MPDANSAPFQALVFDIGGVMIPHDNAVMFGAVVSRCRTPCPTEPLKALLSDPRWMTGAPVVELHGRLQRDFGYGRDWEGFVDDWCCHLAADPAMIDFVQRLAARNRVMLFSNINAEHWERVNLLSDRVLRGFEAYLSHEIGHAKPSVRAFEVVAEKARIEPARSLFIDDLAANVAGALQAGFQAERFTGQAELTRLLVEKGVALG